MSFMVNDGPGKFYGPVNTNLFMKSNGNLVANLSTSGKRSVPLNPPTEGADKYYDPVPLDKYKEKDKAFRFDKANRFDKSKEKEILTFLKDSPKFYTLPAPEVYKEPTSTSPIWRTGPERFDRPRRPQGADQFYGDIFKQEKAKSVPNLRGGGPRLDKNMYRRGAAADVPFYYLPHPTVYKEANRSFRFGRDETAFVTTGSDYAPRHRPAPAPPAKKVDLSAPNPAWVDRLCVHNPRPVRPFLRSPRPSSAPAARGAKRSK